MRKTKLFLATDHNGPLKGEIDEKINDFLERYSYMLIDVKFSVSEDENGYVTYYALLIYDDRY